MTIPFIHRTAVGLHVARHHVYRVDLFCLFGRISRIRCATEPLLGGVEDAVRRLTSRLAPAQAQVAAHLSPPLVRHLVGRAPAGALDDVQADLHAAWVRGQARSLLPPGALLGEFDVCMATLDAGDEGAMTLVAAARKDAVRSVDAGLRAAGLMPVRLGCAGVEAGHVLAYHDGFVAGHSAVLVLDGEEASLLAYREGALQSVVSLECSRVPEEVASRLQAEERGPTDRLYVVGEGAEETAALLEGEGIGGQVIAAPGVTVRAGRRTVRLPGTHLLAGALAMPLVFPTLPALDFLGGVAAESWRTARERAGALQVLLVAGALLAASMLFASGAAAWVASRKARTAAALAAMAGRVSAIEAARTELARLEADVKQAERLVLERTNLASVLETVGQEAPETLWLEQVRAAPGPDAALQVTISGAALDATAVATYLDRLERVRALRDVRLSSSQTIRAATRYHDLLAADHDLSAFSITLNVRDSDVE